MSYEDIMLDVNSVPDAQIPLQSLWNSQLPTKNIQNGNKGNKKILIVFLFALFIFLILGFSYFVKNYFEKNKAVTVSNRELSLMPSNEPIRTETVNSSHLLAYTTTNKEASRTAYLYDPGIKKTLHVLDEISQKHKDIQIGKWSPSGRYLPLIGERFLDKIIFENEHERSFTLYVFDIKDLKVKKIFEPPENTDRADVDIWAGAFNFADPWLDENSIILENNKDFENKINTLTYVTLNGELKTEKRPILYHAEQSNSDLQVKYNLDLATITDKIAEITYENQPLPFIPEGNVIGIVDSQLASLKTPPLLDLRVDDYNAVNPKDQTLLEEEAKRLEKTGLSKMEISKKLLEFIEPKGETIIQMYDLNNGYLNESFEISERLWWTDGILVHTDKKSLIAHQTDKRILSTKKKFILIDPQKTERIKVILENDSPSQREISGYQTLQSGLPFALTADGYWIIAMHDYPPDINSPLGNAKIFMKNITSGEEVTICEINCSLFYSYYPQQFR